MIVNVNKEQQGLFNQLLQVLSGDNTIVGGSSVSPPNPYCVISDR